LVLFLVIGILKETLATLKIFKINVELKSIPWKYWNYLQGFLFSDILQDSRRFQVTVGVYDLPVKENISATN